MLIYTEFDNEENEQRTEFLLMTDTVVMIFQRLN